MAAMRPRSLRRASRPLLVLAVALAHLGVFLLLSLNRAREPNPAAEPTRQAVAFIPLKRARPREVQVPGPARNRKKREPQQAAAPSPVPPAPGAPGPNLTLPAKPGQAAGSRDLPDPYALRDALRATAAAGAGCDPATFKLRPEEQARCEDRMARWAKKGRKIGPAADDPKRAAELEAEEENNSRRAKWKSGYGPSGMANAALPPRPVDHPTSALDDPLPH